MSVEKSKGKGKPKFARVVIFEKKPKAESTNILQDGGKITVKTEGERKYVDMVLDVLRGVNKQGMCSLMMNIVSYHQHCNEERAVDPQVVDVILRKTYGFTNTKR